MEIAHPHIQQGPFLVFLFGNIAGEPGHSGVSQDDVEKAAVVGYIKNRGVGGDILLAQDDHIGAADPNENPKGPLDNGQGTFVFQGRIEFADDPFSDHEWYGQH